MSDPSSIYCSGLRYVCDRDPDTEEATIYDFVVANFNSWNTVEWVNTVSKTQFRLFNVDEDGKLIWKVIDLS